MNEIPDVLGRPEFGQVNGIYSEGIGPTIKFEVRVNLPSRPIVPIREKEPLLILFFKGKTFPPAIFSGRNDFPDLPHVMRRRKNGPAELCYIRENSNDWAVDKEVADVIKRLRDWLADAAAGKLVKPDEPYEPLLIPAKNGFVELDDEEAKNRTDRGKNPWETRAVEVNLSGIKYLRVINGVGTIPTTVYYQANISDKPWTVLVSSPLDVVEIASEIGWDVQPVIKAACMQPQLSQFLFVFGAQRSKIVNGRQNEDEWMACLFIRNKTRKGALVGASKKERKTPPPMEKVWNVKSLSVRSPLTTKLARATSGWSNENRRCQIAVIGAGALGSKVTDSIVRSGLVEVLLIDNDLLATHNLARHTLRSNELGFHKAKKIADYLNDLYSKEENIVTPYCEDFIDRANELSKELNKCKLVIDLSASISVQKMLAKMRFNGILCVPVLTAFMAMNGELTFLLIDGKIKEINADVIEAELISKHNEKDFVKKWLLSSKDILDAGRTLFVAL
ncbi:MAG: ThiF family adenylyltransferase [Candidatus Hermodarchaeota archaeon]